MSSLNAISRVVLCYRPEHLQKAADTLSKVLHISDFEGPYEREDLGVSIILSWNSGLELVAPFGNGRATQQLWNAIRDKGEGSLFSLIWRVPNLDAAEKHASDNGYAREGERIDCLEVEPSWKNRFGKAHEAVIPDVAGVLITFVEFNAPRLEVAATTR